MLFFGSWSFWDIGSLEELVVFLLQISALSKNVDSKVIPVLYRVFLYKTSLSVLGLISACEDFQRFKFFAKNNPSSDKWISLCFVELTASGINWNGNNWANGCDFPGNDLSNAQIASSACGGRCASTSGCTHFAWTTYNGGTCWMKYGPATQQNAVSTGDQTMVCGITGKLERHFVLNGYLSF